MLKVVNQATDDKPRFQTDLFLKNMYVFRIKSFIFVFCKRTYPLTPLKMKELASNTCSTSSVGNFHSADHRLEAAVVFFVIIEMLFEFVCH